MQKLNKYRVYKKYHFHALKKFPLRLLQFKRQKWLFLQQKLKKFLRPFKKKKRFKYKSKYKIFKKKVLEKSDFKKRQSKFKIAFRNAALRKAPIQKWNRRKKTFNNELLTKKTFYILYQRSIGKNFLRQQTKNKNFKNNWQLTVAFLIKPLYRIDIILWFLNFFGSTHQAKQYLLAGKVLVNTKVITTPIFLKVGDIVQISSCETSSFLLLKNLRSKYTQKKKFFTFVEVDYYLKTLVVVKDANEIGVLDCYLMLQEKIKIRSFKHVF